MDNLGIKSAFAQLAEIVASVTDAAETQIRSERSDHHVGEIDPVELKERRLQNAHEQIVFPDYVLKLAQLVLDFNEAARTEPDAYDRGEASLQRRDFQRILSDDLGVYSDDYDADIPKELRAASQDLSYGKELSKATIADLQIIIEELSSAPQPAN